MRNYSEIVTDLKGRPLRVTEAERSFALIEAQKNGDGATVHCIADWYEDEKKDLTKCLELEMIAVGLGSGYANIRLGHEYRTGENLEKDYAMAYEFYLKGSSADWVPIDPEQNDEWMDGAEGEITSLLLQDEGDIEWWLFVLNQHPTRALKCGIADWYMEKGEVDKALELCAESAEEGFPYATRLMLEYYLPHQLRVPIWGKWSQNGVANVEKAKYWYRKAEQAGEDVKEYAGRLGIVSEYVRQLIEQAKDEGNGEAVAKLVLAYLNGNGCPRDRDRAFSYAENLLFEDEDCGVFSELLDAAIKDPEIKRRYNLLMQKANDIEKSV